MKKKIIFHSISTVEEHYRQNTIENTRFEQPRFSAIYGDDIDASALTTELELLKTVFSISNPLNFDKYPQRDPKIKA